MKKELFYLFYFLVAFFMSTNAFAQEQSNPLPFSYKENEMYGTKEEMPRFPGCEDQGLLAGKLSKCAKDSLLNYIYSHLEYPDEAKKQKCEGRVVIQFKIDESGKMTDLNLLRDIGAGCGEAAMKVIKKMQSETTWIPGKQRGIPVIVQYTLPVKFEL